MATPVPYSGTLDVTPQVDPLSPVHVDTPIAAFGGAVAGAITHMGEVSEGAGKELFARAYAMQEMDEHNKADAASADVFTKQTLRYLELSDLPPGDQKAALPQYMRDLAKMREDGAAGLNSPWAKQAYLDQTRRNESMMIWHGAVLGREGFEQATTKAGLAKISSLGDQLATLNVSAGPEFDQRIAGLKSAAVTSVSESKALGRFAPGTPENEAAASRLLSQEIKKVALARSNANGIDGKAFFERMSSGDHPLLLPEDAESIRGVIESHELNKGAADIAREAVRTAPPDATVKDVGALARAKAMAKDPRNPDLADNAEQRSMAEVEQHQKAVFLANQQVRNELMSQINGDKSKDGKVPLSPEEAERMNPGFNQKFNTLDPTSQKALLERFRKNNDIGGVEHNPTGDLTYYSLMRIGINRDTTSTPEDLKTLAEADFTKPQYTSMTRDQISNLIKIQHDVVHQQIQNPPMQMALHLPQVTKMLKDAGILGDDGKAVDQDTYNKFQTEYQQAIIQYGLGAERSVKNDNELGIIAKDLISRETKINRGWLYNSKSITNLIDADPAPEKPDSVTRAARSLFRQAYNREPDLSSPADLDVANQLALHAIYNNLGKSAGSAKSKVEDRVVP